MYIAYCFASVLCVLFGIGCGIRFKVCILLLAILIVAAVGVAISLAQQVGLLTLLMMGIFYPVLALQGGYMLGSAVAGAISLSRDLDRVRQLRAGLK